MADINFSAMARLANVNFESLAKNVTTVKKAKREKEPLKKIYAAPARVMQRRGAPAESIKCPSHDDYVEPDAPAWPQETIGQTRRLANITDHSPADQAVMAGLFQNNQFIHPMFADKSKIERVVLAYNKLPQSYKDRIWRTEADNRTANYKDMSIVADSAFLPSDMKAIWTGAVDCHTDCPGGDCPWTEDCQAHARRKALWDQQIVNSGICHDRWKGAKRDQAKWVADQARRDARLAKKVALRDIMRAERKRSLTMFHPKEIMGGDAMITEIRTDLAANRNHSDPRTLVRMMYTFPATTPLKDLDFKCLIADYFHDGIPGFRITNRHEPKISGIPVHHPDIIRLGREKHQLFMYQFLKNVLNTMKTPQQVPERLRDLSASIDQTLLTLPPISQHQKITPADALDAWRRLIGLTKSRVEDSINTLLGIPDINDDTAHIDLERVKKDNPWVTYRKYLDANNKHSSQIKLPLTIHIKDVDTKTLEKEEANNIITFLLLALFGPSYERIITQQPALFTFDAHKGYINHILAGSTLSSIYRLVTPYNVADSAMTEQFVKDPAPALSPVEAADLADIKAEVDAEEAGAKVTEEDVHEEEEKDDIVPVGNQVGAGRGPILFAFSLAQAIDIHAERMGLGQMASSSSSSSSSSAASSSAAAVIDAVPSDTHMLFDDNWLIYYKNNGFTDQHPYNFSMNMVDAGLYRYIQDTPAAKAMKIPSSFYTIEAPFSAEATRGPSLNYLMMGLLRGSMSDIFGKTVLSPAELYGGLCGMYATIRDNQAVDQFITQLLPIYSIPVSSHALPLFKHIAKAPLFACHMLYDLQHRISALPSRIKWAGDREQYMILKDYRHGVFVTLDTTGYFCALANGVTSLLERKGSIKLVSATITADEWDMVKTKASEAPQQKRKASAASSSSSAAAENDDDEEDVQPAAARGKKAQTNSKKSAKKGGATLMGGTNPTYTRKNTSHSIILDRDYFFLGWLYPLVMAVNEAFHDRHPAEESYTLLQKLKDHVHHPGLFPIVQGQFFHAVSHIPRISKELIASVKELTAETYESNAVACASLLKRHYTAPSSIFSNPVHKRTLLGYLQEMKQALSARYSSKDSTMDLLHALLTQRDETACLALSLLFERLHGRIQNGTSYLGQILGIMGGEILKRVDDQVAWEHLTAVLEKDMQQIKVLTKAPAETATPTEMPAVMPAVMPSNPKMIRYSAKKHNVVRGPVYDKLKKDLRQLRSNRVRAMPMPMPMAAAVAGGSLRKTRRQAKTRHATRHAKKGSRRRND